MNKYLHFLLIYLTTQRCPSLDNNGNTTFQNKRDTSAHFSVISGLFKLKL